MSASVQLALKVLHLGGACRHLKKPVAVEDVQLNCV